MATFPAPATLVHVPPTGVVTTAHMSLRRDGAEVATITPEGPRYVVRVPGRSHSVVNTLSTAYKIACGLAHSMTPKQFFSAMKGRGYFRPRLSLGEDAWGNIEVSASYDGTAPMAGFSGERPASYEEGIATTFAQLTNGGACYAKQ